jgi:hypothetical protein
MLCDKQHPDGQDLQCMREGVGVGDLSSVTESRGASMTYRHAQDDYVGSTFTKREKLEIW